MPREEVQVQFSRREEETYNPHLVPCGNEVSIDQSTPGTTNFIEVETNCRRDAGVLHRNAIAAADKLTDFANTDITTADNGVGTGSLVKSTTYYTTVIPGNRWGNCKVAGTINTQATAGYASDTGSIRLTFGQCTGADYYDLFLSTDAAPKWVGRVTEAQRAAGDYEVTAVGTVAAGGGNPAGSVDVNVAGTGIKAGSLVNNANAIFMQSSAYTPSSAGITSINCTGRTYAICHFKVVLTDLRSQPSLTVVPFMKDDTGEWYSGVLQSLPLLSVQGQTLYGVFVIAVHGASGLKILLDSIAGQGAAWSCYVELV